ncbi:MAG: hypothetical protein ACNS61_08470 [Candidatus Wenzhouxiangella sp. M2_3B_020]
MSDRPRPRERSTWKTVRRAVGVAGLIVAAGFLLWVPAGFVPGIPGVIDVFGIEGLRTPASFTVGGLVLAAIGFFEP